MALNATCKYLVDIIAKLAKVHSLEMFPATCTCMYTSSQTLLSLVFSTQVYTCRRVYLFQCDFVNFIFVLGMLGTKWSMAT